nr:MAG TPA: hypothetical protein [Microviridae sp.]
MKRNYYELQILVPTKGYVTIYAYFGTRSNCVRKFKAFISSYNGSLPSMTFRINTYSSIESMLADDFPIRSASFSYFWR